MSSNSRGVSESCEFDDQNHYKQQLAGIVAHTYGPSSLARAPVSEAMTQQLLREWPPGYGGVERVAHELAVVWGGAIYSFDVKSQRHLELDPLPVSYERYRLRCAAFGRLLLPKPSRN